MRTRIRNVNRDPSVQKKVRKVYKQKKSLSLKNLFILFFVSIFIWTSAILMFANYGGTFAYVMILLSLFIALMVSIFEKKVITHKSGIHKFFMSVINILLVIIYISVAFQSFGILWFLMIVSLWIILLYSGYIFTRFILKSEIKYKTNPSEWEKYKKDKNFLNHHNYHKRTHLREEYDTYVYKEKIVQSLVAYAIIIWFIFFFGAINAVGWEFYPILFILFLVFFLISLMKNTFKYFTQIKKEKLNIYTKHSWKVQYYHTQWKNIFFY